MYLKNKKMFSIKINVQTMCILYGVGQKKRFILILYTLIGRILFPYQDFWGIFGKMIGEVE